MDKTTLGRRINAARKRNGITGEKLAELCNINPTYLRQIEGGTKTPSLPMFCTLCKMLDVSPNYLLPDCVTSDYGEEDNDVMLMLKKATPKQVKLIRAVAADIIDIVDE